jgi:hypothetical protein
VSIATSSRSRALQLGDVASRLATEQPLSAIVALRTELEQKLDLVYRALYGESPNSANAVLVRLAQDGHLDADQFQLGSLLLMSLDAAVHAASATRSTAQHAVSLGEIFAQSLARPALAEAVRLEEQVFRVLSTIPGLEIRRQPTAGRGRHRADFVVRQGDETWIGEIRRIDLTSDVREQLRRAVDQLDNMLPRFQTTRNRRCPGWCPAPGERVVSRVGEVRISLVTVSELPTLFGEESDEL